MLPTSLPSFAERLARRLLLLQGFRSHRVETSIGRMHALSTEGSGSLPPMLLLHGFSSTCVHLAPLLLRLRPHVRRLIAPDMPGHGFSETPAAGMSPATVSTGVRETLGAVLDEPHVVFGNSMGGLAAIRMAHERPDLVRGLILVSPTGAAMSPSAFREFLGSLDFEDRSDALDFVDKVFGRRIPGRRLLAWGTEQKFRSPALRGLLAATTTDNLLTPADLASIEVPTLVIWGGRDALLTPTCREFYRTHLPAHVSFEEPPEFGHSPYLDQPGALAERILAFLGTLSEREAQTRAA